MLCFFRLRQTRHAERDSVSVLRLVLRNRRGGSLSFGDFNRDDRRRPGPRLPREAEGEVAGERPGAWPALGYD